MLKVKQLRICSFLSLFSLMSFIFLLKPVRDVLGVFNGVNNLQWLFTASLIAIIPIHFLFRYFSLRYSLKKIVKGSYFGFALLLVFFYLIIYFSGVSKKVVTSFFVYASISSLYSVSLFWVAMVNSFSSEASKKVFGFVIAGGSLGAFSGSFLASSMMNFYPFQYLLLVAAFFLLVSLFFMSRILNLSENKRIIATNQSKFNLGVNFWKKLLKTTNHKYLFSIVIFMLLYSSISTVLYFEQAYLVEGSIQGNENRLRYFSRIDSIINLMSLFGQLFITKWFIRKYSISTALSIMPVILIIGFMIVNLKTSLLFVSILVILHKAGNYILIKPAREILFTICTREEKYKVKNFIDTIVYRGGDAFMGWVFTLLISLGLGLSIIALLTIPILLYWAIVGNKLGNYHIIKENINNEE